MQSENIKKKIEELKEKIRLHDYLYYVMSQPEISDSEYDGLLRKLKEMEDANPAFRTADSPTVRISGGLLKGFKPIVHIRKMLSLDNTYSFKELKDWDDRVRKAGVKKYEYVVDPKIDGVSANLIYRKGALLSAATRGDSQTGEDVTENIKTISAIPLILRGKNIPELIEVRGEIYMGKKEFLALNKYRQSNNEVLFANPRNAASGSLKLLDRDRVRERKLNFFAHSLGELRGANIKTHWEFLQALKEWGIPGNPYSKLCGKMEEVIEYCFYIQQHRDNLGYDIDGMVVKINNISQQRTLGATAKSPRWAIAYKFPARQATTEILNINVNVGRTGVITPAAELRPVECGGVIIRNATLHNFDEIGRLNIRVGDVVLVERAGDVIPKVVKVVKNRGQKEFKVPAKCPVCGNKIVKEKEEDVAYRCINPMCPAQLERGLLHFASRGAMDIEGLGESVAVQLIQRAGVRSYADIYKLTAGDLSQLDLFKEKKIANLLGAIQKSKKRTLKHLIYALGIRHVGEKAASVLAEKFHTLENIIKAKKRDLEEINDVGPVMAEAIENYFSLPQTRKMIEELRKEGLNFKEERSASVIHTPLSGKRIVFTGELDGYSRHEAEEMTRRAGGILVSSVSRKTDIVVAGRNPGTKYNKAKLLGIDIIDEKNFSVMIKGIR